MIIDRRRQIIEAATKSFSLFGYKGTTMEQIARLAHVGKGTIYRFFPNKEALLEEIMKSFIHNIIEIAESSIDPERSFAENLHRALYRVLDFRSKNELMVILSHEVRDIGTEAVLLELKKTEQALHRFVKEQVKIAIDNGELQNNDPDLTAFILIKIYLALVVDWTKRGKSLKKEDILQLLEFYFMNGVAHK